MKNQSSALTPILLSVVLTLPLKQQCTDQEETQGVSVVSPLPLKYTLCFSLRYLLENHYCLPQSPLLPLSKRPHVDVT